MPPISPDSSGEPTPEAHGEFGLTLLEAPLIYLALDAGEC